MDVQKVVVVKKDVTKLNFKWNFRKKTVTKFSKLKYYVLEIHSGLNNVIDIIIKIKH